MFRTLRSSSKQILAALTSLLLVLFWVPALVGNAAAASSTLPASGSAAFEAGDGDMAPSPNLLDWGSTSVNTSSAFANSPDSHTQCGTSDDIFVQGTEEDDTTVSIGCQSSPPKVDLQRLYQWHQTVNNHTYLYLAWEAPIQNGANNNHIDFELNQQQQPAVQNTTSNQTWTLNRTAGDLLFDFDITPGAPEVFYSTWVTSGACDSANHTAPCWSPKTQLPSNEAVAAISSSTFTDPITGDSIISGAFGEMGVDLTAANIFQPDVCTNFADFWAKGRSSGSGTTSEMKDLVLPQTVSISNCASIVTKKATVPSGSTQSFQFGLTGGPSGHTVNVPFSLTDGGSKTVDSLRPGTYADAETVPTGWIQTGATCDNGNLPGAVTVAAGDTVTCTFTNTKLAKLNVSKVTNPSGSAQSFGFTATGGPSGHTVNDTFSLTDGQTHGVSNGSSVYLYPGSYDVAESATAGWDNTNATCDNGNSAGAVTLKAGDNVTCTFTNTQRGKILVEKVTAPSGSTQTFDFTASGGPTGHVVSPNDTFQLADGGSHYVKNGSSDELWPGSGYAVSEQLPANWSQTSATCDNGTPSNVQVLPGATTTCVFNNTEAAFIIVKKVTNPVSDTTTEFPFSIQGNDAGSTENESFHLVGGGQQQSNGLVAGSYDVSEGSTAGWDLTSATCNNNDSPSAVHVTAGQTVICTFTNTERAHLIVKKVTVPTGSTQQFPFTVTGGPSTVAPFNLADGGSKDSGAILAGTYNVAEDLSHLPEWDQTGASCDNGDAPSSVTVNPGDTVTCTITNTQRAHLIVKKVTVPSGSTQQFPFTVTGGPSTVAPFNLADGGSKDSGAILAGTYNVAEDLGNVPEWGQTGASCDNGDAPTSVTVNAGDTVTCTITNTHYVSLSVTKVINANGDAAPAGGFVFNVACTDGTTATLTFHDAGTQSVAHIIEGSQCDVTENGTTGWTVSPAATRHVVVGANGATVSFTNTRNTGVITVTKSIQGAVAGASTVFTFDVLCPGHDNFDQTLVLDAAQQTSVTSSAIPTGLSCSVTERGTPGWQQTVPVQGGVDVTVPGTAAFINTRLTGPLQLVKSVSPSSGSYTSGAPGNTLTYTLTLSPTGQLDHTNVVVSDYIPGYDPADTKSGKTKYVAGSATCSTGCAATYDDAHKLLTWNVGSVAHDAAPVVFTYKVTIIEPSFNATAGVPTEVIDNVGYVQSTQQGRTPSNQVKTPVTAVLGVKIVRKPKKLPFTGLPTEETVALALLLIGTGIVLTRARRREH